MDNNVGASSPEYHSGRWLGFSCLSGEKAKDWMDLELTFGEGIVSGRGNDGLGPFVVRGRYHEDSGKCLWTKRYVGGRDVSYVGYNEGQGIWGAWEMTEGHRGGFHIWPSFMEILDRDDFYKSLQESWVISLFPDTAARRRPEWLTGADEL